LPHIEIDFKDSKHKQTTLQFLNDLKDGKIKDWEITTAMFPHANRLAIEYKE